MKKLQSDFQSVLKSLKVSSEKMEKILRKLDKLETAKPARKQKAKARSKVTNKSTKVSAAATVLAIIKRSRKGVHVAILRNKTGFEGQKISNIVQRFKREGKIKSVGRGIYAKA